MVTHGLKCPPEVDAAVIIATEATDSQVNLRKLRELHTCNALYTYFSKSSIALDYTLTNPYATATFSKPPRFS
jgi:hypothetical protein